MLKGQHFLRAKGRWHFIIMASLTFTAADKTKLGIGQQIPLDILVREFAVRLVCLLAFRCWKLFLWNAEGFVFLFAKI